MFDERIGKWQSKVKITKHRRVKAAAFCRSDIKRGVTVPSAA
jgi:hypothetical protein